MLLKTITVVGIGVWNLAPGNKRANTSRHCSSRVATLRISFSLALPMSVKFFERTLVQLSFAWTVENVARQSRMPAIIGKRRLRGLSRAGIIVGGLLGD